LEEEASDEGQDSLEDMDAAAATQADPPDSEEQMWEAVRELYALITDQPIPDDTDNDLIFTYPEEEEAGVDEADVGTAADARPPVCFVTLHAEPTARQLSDLGQFDSKIQFYQQRLERPLYPGCEFSVQQAVYLLMSWKADHAVTDKAFDSMLFMMSVLLPKVSYAAATCPNGC
jgi:hypothetical protein